MQNSAYAVFGKQRKNNSNKSKNSNKGWFNKECYEARKKFNVSRNIFTRNKNEINKQAYLSDKREYTKIKRNSKRAFKTIEGKRVANLAKTDPKGFWQTLRNNTSIQPTKQKTSLSKICFNILIHYMALRRQRIKMTFFLQVS